MHLLWRDNLLRHGLRELSVRPIELRGVRQGLSRERRVQRRTVHLQGRLQAVRNGVYPQQRLLHRRRREYLPDRTNLLWRDMPAVLRQRRGHLPGRPRRVDLQGAVVPGRKLRPGQ